MFFSEICLSLMLCRYSSCLPTSLDYYNLTGSSCLKEGCEKTVWGLALGSFVAPSYNQLVLVYKYLFPSTWYSNNYPQCDDLFIFFMIIMIEYVFRIVGGSHGLPDLFLAKKIWRVRKSYPQPPVSQSRRFSFVRQTNVSKLPRIQIRQIWL